MKTRAVEKIVQLSGIQNKTKCYIINFYFIAKNQDKRVRYPNDSTILEDKLELVNLKIKMQLLNIFFYSKLRN